MEKVNFRRKVAKLRRLIENNFTDEDWHVTLTYKKQSRPDLKQAKAYLGKFHAKMKRWYAKAGVEYKWICVTEYRTAAIHHHIIINGMEGVDKILKECWPHGHINLSPIYPDGDVEGLAEYLLKETRETKKKAAYAAGHSLKQPPSLYQEQECCLPQKGY